jgi:NADH-quinone oxidoreductase subunit C
MTLTLTGIADKIVTQQTTFGMLELEVAPQHLIEVVTQLYHDKTTPFTFLTDLCGVHRMSPVETLGIAIHLHSLVANIRIRIICNADSAATPELPSLTPLFEAANWMERETFDFYGIQFIGHPNLIRILNEDEMTIFPMRKTYPLEDATREDKDDRMFGR